MVRPPLTMLFIAKGLFTVPQEIETWILILSILKEPCPVTKKMKYRSEQGRSGTKRGESLVQQESLVQ